MKPLFKNLITSVLIVAAMTFTPAATAGETAFETITYTWDKGAFTGGQYKLVLKEKFVYWEG